MIGAAKGASPDLRHHRVGLVDELFEMNRAAHHVELHHVTELNQSARARLQSTVARPLRERTPAAL